MRFFAINFYLEGQGLLWSGQFLMGDLQGNGQVDEVPVHDMTIPQTFAISQYEITVKEFALFVQSSGYKTEAEMKNGCYMRGGRSWKIPAKDFTQEEDHPVVCVSWNDANAYVSWLSQQAGKTYRLPLESEWEYAARGDVDTDYAWGNDVGKARAMCGFCDGKRIETGTVKVGLYEPNAYGVYDMSGNVWEWTSSEYAYPYDGRESEISKFGSTEGKRAIRSGGWLNTAVDLRVSNRGVLGPTDRYSTLGIRVVREEAVADLQTEK